MFEINVISRAFTNIRHAATKRYCVRGTEQTETGEMDTARYGIPRISTKALVISRVAPRFLDAEVEQCFRITLCFGEAYS